MAREKGKTKAEDVGKRKAEAGDEAHGQAKKARREPASPVVKLPHSPGGTVHEPKVKKAKKQASVDGAHAVAGAAVPAQENSTAAASKDAQKLEARVQGQRAADGAAAPTDTAKHLGALEGLGATGIETKRRKKSKQAAAEPTRAPVETAVEPGSAVHTQDAGAGQAQTSTGVNGDTPTLTKEQRRRKNHSERKRQRRESGRPDPAPATGGGALIGRDVQAEGKKIAEKTSKGDRRQSCENEQKPKRDGIAMEDDSRAAEEEGGTLTKGERDFNSKEVDDQAVEREVHDLTADDAEALGSAELDNQISMLDVDALAERAAAEADAMSVSNAVKRRKRSDWTLSGAGGGRFIDHDPLFATDPTTGAAVLIAATQREIQVLSVQTSLPVRTHALPPGLCVRSFALDATPSENLHAVCDNGASVVWDWTKDDTEPHLIPIAGVKAVAAGGADDQGKAMIYLKDIRDRGAGCTEIIHGEKLLHTSEQRLEGIQVLADGEYIVCHGAITIVIGRREESRNYRWAEVSFTSAVTCMDTRITYSGGTNKKDKRRAQVGLALGGSIEGQLFLYDDITSVFVQQGQASLPAPRILHWHRETVSAVKFSRDGSYLISGGKETVLVLWQLGTGNKQFLPHLTSEIERIVVSPEGDRYAVQMGDNSIMVLSTSELKPVANFAGLQMVCAPPVPAMARKDEVRAYYAAKESRKSAVAVLHPHQSNRLMLAVPATQPKAQTEAAEARPFLQTYDLRTSRHVTRQALTRNNVTDFNLGPEKTPIASPDVVHMAISHDGLWLATVDEWMPPASDVDFLGRSTEDVLNEREKRRECFLKLWRWDEPQGHWTLSTRVDAPHARAGKQTQGGGRVLALTAHPVSAGFATVGEDCRVRTWRPKIRQRHGVALKSQSGDEVLEWVCRRTVELPAENDEHAESLLHVNGASGGAMKACLAYSEDGSMLAAAQSYGNAADRPTVHLIDTASGTIKASQGGPAPARLEHLAFLDRYLIAVAREATHVWDLITDTLQHRYPISTGVPRLAVNSKDGSFAISVGSHVKVYKPTEVRPLYKQDCKRDVAAVLAGAGSKGYTLLLEDATVRKLVPTGALQRRELPAPPAATDMPLATEDAAVTQGSSSPDVKMAEVLALPATESRGPVFEEAEDDRPVVRPEQLAQIFDAAQSFVMPPVRDMFEAVAGLYGRRPVAHLAEVAG
ncbi:NET1-associated nuclear protein 1 [Teratosphaeriaceae sp. CCFEE 6253]|nr:NET1-associated nuclear protein 1 [Teratosphaeriaceae sp. CCFEE 6253]